MSESTATGPLVSVIVAAYKQPAMLNQALASIAAQTYQPIEIVVIDDHSGPEFVSQYELPRNATLIVNEQNVGRASVVRNKAIRAARGEYIAFLDQDDLWVPTKIERQIAVLADQPTALMTYSTCVLVDGKGRVVRRRSPKLWAGRDTARALLKRNTVRAPSCVLMRRRALDTAGWFDETIKGSADWDMWLRLSGQARGAVIHQHEPLTAYRLHEGQWSRDEVMIARGSLAVMRSAGKWLPPLRPDLVGLLRRRTARWLCRLAQALQRAGQGGEESRALLAEAVQLRPLDIRARLLMLSLGKGK